MKGYSTYRKDRRKSRVTSGTSLASSFLNTLLGLTSWVDVFSSESSSGSFVEMTSAEESLSLWPTDMMRRR